MKRVSPDQLSAATLQSVRTWVDEYDADTDETGLGHLTRYYSTRMEFRSLHPDAASGVHVGVLDWTLMRKCIEKRNQARSLLISVIREVLDEPNVDELWAWQLIFFAEERCRKTKNALWAWMVLDIFVQAGLPPPPWVWKYLAGVSHWINCSVQQKLPFPHTQKRIRAEERPLRDDRLIAALGLAKVGRGKHDLTTQFRTEMLEFRLVGRVVQIVEKCGSLGAACEEVARQVRVSKSTTYRAYAKFFGRKGRITRTRNSYRGSSATP